MQINSFLYFNANFVFTIRQWNVKGLVNRRHNPALSSLETSWKNNEENSRSVFLHNSVILFGSKHRFCQYFRLVGRVFVCSEICSI